MLVSETGLGLLVRRGQEGFFPGLCGGHISGVIHEREAGDTHAEMKESWEQEGGPLLEDGIG